MLLVLGFVLSLAVAVFRPDSEAGKGRRSISIVWSLAFLVALLFCWYVIAIADRWQEPVGTPIGSPQELAQFIADHPASFAGYTYQIPTGVYLQSFEFLTPNKVELSGFVWQTYSPDIPADVQRGVVFPEAVEEAYDAQEAWRTEDEDGVHIGWYFNGEFRQNFDYRLYPFDRQDIWLRLWSPEAREGVALVPDFAAYRDLTPSTLPGIDTQFVYGGWDPEASTFTYDLVDYNTDFGLGYGFSGAPDPEFYFNLAVARDPLGPLLEHVLLEASIAIILFVLLVLMEHDSDLRDQSGLTIFDLIVASGGLLFAVILDHTSLRSGVESQTLVYLDWFPLTLEIFIVLVVLSAVFRVVNWRPPIFGGSGVLLPVLAYWPTLLGVLLIVTLRVYFF